MKVNGVTCKKIRYDRVTNGQWRPTTAVLIVPISYNGGVCWTDNKVTFTDEYGCAVSVEDMSECYAKAFLPTSVREVEVIQARIWMMCCLNPKTFIPTSTAAPEVPACTCDSRDLFNYGCRCPYSKKP